MNHLVSLLRLVSLMLCAALLTPSAHAATLNVPAQYPTIQAAVTAATVGDTILLADGIYTGVGNYYIDFHGKDLTVKSANGAVNCIIDCQQAGSAFYLHSGETTASYLEGLTVTNGVGGAFGGGIYVSNTSNLTVDNCTFTNNQASYAGGGAYGITATNCQFNRNKTTNFNNSGYGGGGMYGGTATNCTFNGNVTGGAGGGGSGGGMNGIMATNCVFTNNQATSGGDLAAAAQLSTVVSRTIMPRLEGVIVAVPRPPVRQQIAVLSAIAPVSEADYGAPMRLTAYFTIIRHLPTAAE